MIRRLGIIIIVLLAVFAAAIYLGQMMAASQLRLQAAPQVAAGSGFAYQGHLEGDGDPEDGSFVFNFQLYDAPTGGNQIGSTISQTLPVSNGRFMTNLDFGADAFNGEVRFLRVSIKNEGGLYIILSPRHPLTPVPMVHYASQVPAPANIIRVAKEGGDYDSVSAALAAITDAAADNPYLVRVAPGVYTDSIDLKSHVDIAGSGPEVTVLRGLGSNTVFTTDGSSATVRAAGLVTAELRSLAVESITTDAFATGVWAFNAGDALRLTEIAVKVESPVAATGLANLTSTLSLDGGQIFTNGDSQSAGIINFNAALQARNLQISTSSAISGNNAGINSFNSQIFLDDVQIKSAGGENNTGLADNSGSLELVNGDIEAVAGPGLKDYGIAGDDTSIFIRDSQVKGEENAISISGISTVDIATSLLIGDVDGDGITCFAVYDENLDIVLCDGGLDP